MSIKKEKNEFCKTQMAIISCNSHESLENSEYSWKTEQKILASFLEIFPGACITVCYVSSENEVKMRGISYF